MNYDKQHGGPWDRGSADAYYGRAAEPHKYPAGTYKGARLVLTDPAEVAAYMAGYDQQEDRKDYGDAG